MSPQSETEQTTFLIPLAQYREPMARPCVREGARVRAGQRIATPETTGSVAVHAPVDAIVAGVREVDTPYREHVGAVELRPVPDSSVDGPQPLDVGEPRNRAELMDAISGGGVYLAEPWPQADAPPPDWLIVNGLETEFVHTGATQAIIDHPDRVAAAANWLGSLLQAGRTTIAVDRHARKTCAAIRRFARGTTVQVAALRAKYPAGMTPLLVRRVTGREIPHLASAADVGVCVVDVRALLDVRAAVQERRPQTSVWVTVTDWATQHASSHLLPLGMTVGRLASRLGIDRRAVRLVTDNVLAGPLVRHPETVLTKHTSALMVVPVDQRPERAPTGCIRCGQCQDRCPVGLDPRALLDLVERRRFEAVARLWPTACVECGLCDYVCPSALPLMRAVLRSRSHVASA